MTLGSHPALGSAGILEASRSSHFIEQMRKGAQREEEPARL